MNIQLIIVLLVGILAVIVLLKRFSGGRNGKLYPSKGALESYTSFHVDPEKQYYSSGVDVYPNALMGLHKNWVLESDLWKKRELNTAGMQELVTGMQDKAMEKTLLLHGFDLLDDRGQKIGDWYSVMGLSIGIKILGEHRISITTPPHDTYTETK